MNIRDRAIEAIRELPDTADIEQVIRGIAFIAGIEAAGEELDLGQGMTAEEAKLHLQQCLAK